MLLTFNIVAYSWIFLILNCALCHIIIIIIIII